MQEKLEIVMLDRIALQKDLLANRHRWQEERINFIRNTRNPFNYQLAIASHLYHLSGIECGLECPVVIGPTKKRYLDIWIPLALLDIEIDGSHHYLEEEYVETDLQRTDELEHLGIKVIRFTNDEVLKKFPEVIDEIIRICAEREYVPETSFIPSITAYGDPITHYVLTSKNNQQERVDLHSQRARDLGLEYLDGRRTFV